ncbi:MAG: hypothetical protein AAGK33_04620 [Pseudomonadota bacterium]
MTSPLVNLDKASKLNKALVVPEDVYDHPEEVSNDASLTKAQKLDVLHVWQSNERALLRASGEGMNGGERPQLQAVVKELDKLSA